MADWQIRIDVGGTFSDGWALTPSGSQIRCKVLSSGILRASVVAIEDGWLVCERPLSDHDQGLEGFSVDGALITESVPNLGKIKVEGQFQLGQIIELLSGEDASVVTARLLTGTAPGSDFPRADLRVATTRGTNALLERKGTPVDLYTSKGFESLLEVRDQRRPDLFELSPSLAVPVTKRVIGVSGRLDRQGRELEPLDESELEAQREAKAVAIAMIHADVAPGHEKRVAEILRDSGFVDVSVSHEIAPMIRLWPRL